MKTGKQMLKDAWNYGKTKEKLYGVTDLDKKTIKVNKKYHKSKGNHQPNVKKNKDGSANLLDTIVHEKLHAEHPKAHEKTIRKLATKRSKKLSKKSKQKLYNKFN